MKILARIQGLFFQRSYMNPKQKISISQNPATSTTGHVPVKDLFDYYLDVNGLKLDQALEHIRNHSPNFVFIDVDLDSIDSQKIDPEHARKIGTALAQDVIEKRHPKISVVFSSKRVDSLGETERKMIADGKMVECFGMGLVEVEL